MNADVKARWVAALRSGDYAQTRGALHRSEPVEDGAPAGFCCLGVLCDLAIKAGVVEPWSTDDSFEDRMVIRWQEPVEDDEYDDERVRTEPGVLPGPVAAWAGLGDLNPNMGPGNQTLAVLNDAGRPFAEIADLIEGQL